MNEAIKKLLGQQGGKVISGQIHPERQDFKNEQDLLTRIAEFGAEEGWLCYTGEVVLFTPGLDLHDAKRGRLLSAELVRGDHSLHVRQAGSDWSTWAYHFQKGCDGIVLEQQFIATSKAKEKKLRYQTLWEEDKQSYGALQPKLSRFAGFVEGED